MVRNLRKVLPPKDLIDEFVGAGPEILFSDGPILSVSAVPPNLRLTELAHTDLNPNNNSIERTRRIHSQY
jgi:hypothetical protein